MRATILVCLAAVLVGCGGTPGDEPDPQSPECTSDLECLQSSGQICKTGTCVEGCHGDQNCRPDQHCDITTGSYGACVPRAQCQGDSCGTPEPLPTTSTMFEGHYDVEIGHLDVSFLVESYGARIVLECTTSGALQGTTRADYADFDSAVIGACVIGEGRHAMRFNMPQYTFGAWVNYDDSIRKTFPLCRLGTWVNPPCVDR